MGDARAVLTLMNADGEISERFLHPGDATVVQLTSQRFSSWHSQESQAEESKQLALIHISPKLRLILEPNVAGVEIEPPCEEFTGSISEDRIVLPHSQPDQGKHHYIHLRPGDIVHFADHQRLLRYMVRSGDNSTPRANMPPAITGDDDVQVKSSDPKAPANMQLDSETDDEADLDRNTTPANATPATSRQADAGEIKETPRHHSVNGDDAPFSTAREPPEGLQFVAPEPVMQPNSDVAYGLDLTEADGATTSDARKVPTPPSKHSQDFTPQVISFDSIDVEGSQPVSKIKRTYAGHSRRLTPDEPQDFDGDEGKLDAAEAEGLRSDAVTSEAFVEPTTSDALYPDGVTLEVAARSMSQKRKREGEGAIERTSSKARKVAVNDETVREMKDDELDVDANGDAVTSTAATKGDDAPERNGGSVKVGAEDDSATNVESDDDGPSQVSAGPKVSSGRLPQVSRTEDPEAADDEEDDEESAVQPTKRHSTRGKSSPEVVVQAQRSSKRKSKTPADTPGTPSSTATSTISGKPPKVLVSGYKVPQKLVNFLKKHGCDTIADATSRRSNFLCVVSDTKKLSRTPKVLRSLALGKQVVTARWITESDAAKELLDPTEFVHDEVAATSNFDRRKLFFGKVLYFTNGAVKEYGQNNWAEMKKLATEIGASSVDSGSGGKGGGLTGRNSIIYIGTDDDADTNVLISEHNRVVFHKDILKEAIVSGGLDLENEKYRLAATSKTKKGRR